MRRLGWVGLGATALLVALLVGSLVAGMRGGEDAPVVLPGETSGAVPRVRVEVLNAAGVPGLARRATEQLRDRGFDVVYYGNARSVHGDSSVVVHRAGEESAVDEVAETLEIDRVRSEPDTTLYLEATVVLGKDWQGIPPVEESEEP